MCTNLNKLYTARNTHVAINRLPVTNNQIDPELSDLVIYSQAVKFKGFSVSNYKQQPVLLNPESNFLSTAEFIDLKLSQNDFASPKNKFQVYLIK